MKLVLVEWFDSHSVGDGWKPLDELGTQCGPVLCRSVGWLVAEEDGHRMIVPHISAMDDEDTRSYGNGEVSIPIRAIKKMTILRGNSR